MEYLIRIAVHLMGNIWKYSLSNVYLFSFSSSPFNGKLKNIDTDCSKLLPPHLPHKANFHGLQQRWKATQGQVHQTAQQGIPGKERGPETRRSKGILVT